MGHKFAEIAFTDSVREVQETLGSRKAYAKLEAGADSNQTLGDNERTFIERRDSFYMASVSETGWPYVQHRGGPAGFVRVLDENRIGFADFAGNRQYISVGNLRKDDRVSLFFMDYPNRTRLKMLGRVRLVGDDEVELCERLAVPGRGSRVRRPGRARFCHRRRGVRLELPAAHYPALLRVGSGRDRRTAAAGNRGAESSPGRDRLAGFSSSY